MHAQYYTQHTHMHTYIYIYTTHRYIYTTHRYIYTMHTFNSCNTGTSTLPDMYTRSQRAANPRAEGLHIYIYTTHTYIHIHNTHRYIYTTHTDTYTQHAHIYIYTTCTQRKILSRLVRSSCGACLVNMLPGVQVTTGLGFFFYVQLI